MYKPARRLLHHASDWLQAGLLAAAMGLLRALGPVRASNLGGWIARTVGPALRVSRVAEANLRHCLPTLSAPERRRTIRAVWDNLGRTSAELPHLASFRATALGPGWELSGGEHLAALGGSQALFFSGHFGNWELFLPIAAQLGLPVAGFYRAASNPTANAVIQGMRRRALGADAALFAKGAAGSRAALRHLRAGGSLGLLMDQKMNDGLPVPFFGRMAMTATALGTMAVRFGCPIMPVRVERIAAARFRLVCEPPLPTVLTGVTQTDVYTVTEAVNRTLERWIRADPGAWLWLHRRWPKSGSLSGVGLPPRGQPA